MSNDVKRIIGNTVGIPSPQTDFNETDPTKGSYLKNRESLIQLIKNSGGGSGGDATSDITDLGTFELLYDENMNEVSNTSAGFNKAMDEARQTGVYKICIQEGRVLDDGTINITLSETYLLFVIADVGGDHEIVSQLCFSQDTYNDTSPNYVHPPVIRKYCYDEQKKKYVWVTESLESTLFKVNDINEPNIDPMQCYPSVEAVSNFVNEKCKDNIVDLGTYKVEVDPDTGNMIIDESSQFRNAVNEAKQTGIYKITHTEAGAQMPFILVVLGSVDLRGKDLVTQYCFGDNPFLPADYNVPSLPRIRKYYYSDKKNAYVWTDDEYFNSESIFQTTTNLVHDDTNFNENNELKYPSVGSMVRYIDRKLQPEQPITTLPDILESNKEYIIGGFLDSVFISFPSIANKGDVIYITFYAENVDGLPNLVIDTTNTSDIELIPEPSAGYEIFAKYNGEIWIVDYSEYSLGW